jgi:hypothetical protein
MKTLSLCLVLLLAGGAVYAQQPPNPEAAPPFAPGEVQKLLDGYALYQSQEFLALNDAQFTAFLPKLRALQDVRRRNEQERLRLLQELRRMTNGKAAQFPENELRDRVRALRELETRAVADTQRAIDAVDQTLDARQQARFRVFEQEIEQRKLQLLMRARQQANRANRPLAAPR